MAKRQQIDRNLAQYALQGIEAGIEKLQNQAAELRRWLGKKTAKASRGRAERMGGAEVAKAAKAPRRRRKRTMSAEARKRIGDAQRKRWAAQKAKQSSGEAKTQKPSIQRGARKKR